MYIVHSFLWRLSRPKPLLQHYYHTHTPPSAQPLTWQHDIKSLPHREQVDDSTVREVHPGDIKIHPGNIEVHPGSMGIIYYCLRAL